MKTNLILIFAFATLLTTTAQTQDVENLKTIAVNGSAEMTIQPDEIELEIILSEYVNSKDKKIKIDDIESDFYKILKKNNIDIKTLTLDNTNANSNWYWWYWWNHRYYDPTKTITLKLDNKTNFLKLVEDLNQKGTQSIRIVKSTNKEIQKLRKEVKKEAMRAAKEKATYLLESVDEEIGGLVFVEEIPETSNYNWFHGNLSNVVSNSIVSNSSSQNTAIENVGEIKLRYEIKAKFEIKTKSN